jgi:hypothetical protein
MRRGCPLIRPTRHGVVDPSERNANQISAGLPSELRSDAEPAHWCRQAAPSRPLNQEPGWFDLRANGRRDRTRTGIRDRHAASRSISAACRRACRATGSMRCSKKPSWFGLCTRLRTRGGAQPASSSASSSRRTRSARPADAEAPAPLPGAGVVRPSVKWWSIPLWPPRALTRRLQASNQRRALLAPAAFARYVGAPLVHQPEPESTRSTRPASRSAVCVRISSQQRATPTVTPLVSKSPGSSPPM